MALTIFFAEPFFLGGMYRICAVQLGGLDALLDDMVAALVRRGKAKMPLMQHRVGDVAQLRFMAAAATEALARQLTDPSDPAAVARDAILAREGIEQCIVRALAIAERSLGTEVHREDTTVSRLRRDLSFYIRQAAVDERLIGFGAWYLKIAPRNECMTPIK